MIILTLLIKMNPIIPNMRAVFLNGFEEKYAFLIRERIDAFHTFIITRFSTFFNKRSISISFL